MTDLPTWGLSLVSLAGQPLKDIHGYVSHEVGEPVFKMTRVIFADGRTMEAEGEHDLPYLTDGSLTLVLPGEVES